MRTGLFASAVTSLMLAAWMMLQTVPSQGWLKGALWGLGFGLGSWLIFFAALHISYRMRSR